MLSIHQPGSSGAVAALPATAPIPALNPMTFSWVMKRALLGVAILFIAFGGIAWLTYATIEHNGVDGIGSETAEAE